MLCTAYSPLGHSQSDLLQHPAVLAVAAEKGRTPAQVLLRWNTQRGVAVVPKAGSEGHVRENIEGMFTWRLTWDQKVGWSDAFVVGGLVLGWVDDRGKGGLRAGWGR